MSSYSVKMRTGIRPRSSRLAQVGAHVLAYPVQEGTDPRIGLPAGGLGDRGHGVEQVLLASKQGLGGRVGRRPERSRGCGFDLGVFFGLQLLLRERARSSSLPTGDASRSRVLARSDASEAACAASHCRCTVLRWTRSVRAKPQWTREAAAVR